LFSLSTGILSLKTGGLSSVIIAHYFLVFYAMVERLGVWQYPYSDRCKGTAGKECGEE